MVVTVRVRYLVSYGAASAAYVALGFVFRPGWAMFVCAGVFAAIGLARARRDVPAKGKHAKCEHGGEPTDPQPGQDAAAER